MPSFEERKEPGLIQESIPDSPRESINLSFYGPWRKLHWSLTSDTLIIMKGPFGTVRTPYPLAAISDVSQEPAIGKFTVIIVVISGKKHRLLYPNSQREAGEQAYHYLMRHAGTPEQQKKRARFEEFKAGKEMRKMCNLCGHVFVYTYQDYLENERLKKQAVEKNVLSAVQSFASQNSSVRISMPVRADEKKIEIRDFDRCPKCNSTDLREVSEAEFRAAINSNRSQPSGASFGAPFEDSSESSSAGPYAAPSEGPSAAPYGGPSAAPAAPNAAQSAAPYAAPDTASAESTVAVLGCVADDLKKYKDLLDAGALTQEEFDAVKKRLLEL